MVTWFALWEYLFLVAMNSFKQNITNKSSNHDTELWIMSENKLSFTIIISVSTLGCNVENKSPPALVSKMNSVVSDWKSNRADCCAQL